MEPPPLIPPTPPQPVLSYSRREPIKVKAYGLIPLTRAVYVRLQIAVFIVAGLLLLWLAFLPPDWLTASPYGAWFLPLVAIAIIAEGLETLFMLRQFSKREREGP